jgi:hypothetical protein
VRDWTSALYALRFSFVRVVVVGGVCVCVCVCCCFVTVSLHAISFSFTVFLCSLPVVDGVDDPLGKWPSSLGNVIVLEMKWIPKLIETVLPQV